MKYLMIILCLTITSANAQIKFSGITRNYSLATQDSSFTLRLESPKWDSVVYDPQYLTIQGDTTKAILFLVKVLNQQSERHRKEAERANLAYDILSNIRTDGFVTDWKRWRLAVARYVKFSEYQSEIETPMPPKKHK